jgi:glycosidase
VLHQYDQTGNDQSIKLWFTSNHDENSWNGTEYEKYGDAVKALTVFSFTWDGIPLIYSGQELPNKKRLQFFEKDVIEWNGKFELEDFYSSLLQLRKKNPALRAGDKNVKTYLLHTNAKNQMLAYLRKNGNHEVLALINLSDTAVDFKLSDHHVSGKYKEVFSHATIEAGAHSWQLQPWSFALLEK